MAKVTLSHCSRAELLRVIALLKDHFYTNGDYYLSMALGEVAREREEKRAKMADHYAEEAYKMRREAADILKKYEGKTIGDIRPEDMQAARDLLIKAQALDNKWEKVYAEL